ncbi:hypothetical protein [Mesorhizobium sp. 113-3-3]|uniref:hypothetical protein n=1 Tax=Mesorhizobium sp. 113-3-3 TaxID=2744516 RepID=UPI00193613B2|nr:hypothetical protein [Mesorhizobium sp. 113-3-3]BCG76989.1 hypothetical protein MesoLj113b_05310 [Mesorhizobium sp. 113-3-3]
MPILDFMTGNAIAGVLQRGERGRRYQAILNGLTPLELQNVRAALDAKISRDDIHTAGWMPGNDWNNTPFQPIFDGPAQHDFSWSGLMFGLMVLEAFERHPDDWLTGKFEVNGVDIGSRTYWRRRY